MIIALHFVVCTSLLCGILAWVQRGANKKPRIYLSICFVLWAVVMLIRLLVIYDQGVPERYAVLPVLNLYGGLLLLLLLYLYPIEVVNPEWPLINKVLLLFMPLLATTIILAVVPFEFRDLYSFAQVWEYIEEPNVWFRVVLLFACIVPYSLLLLFVPYNWENSSVDSRWIRDYTMGVQGIAVLYILFMLTGSIMVSAIHLTYVVFFVSWVLYQELYLRLIPPFASTRFTKSAICPDNVARVDSGGFKPQKMVSNPLWEKLKLQMDEKELWREPDVTLEELASRLSTNRATLSAMIRQQGYTGYSEFVNRRRIEAFTQAVHHNVSVNTQQLFYEVGFRSKSTAIRNFRLYMGCTPAEYIQRTAENRDI